MHTLYHAKSSAARWGGDWEEYMPIHDFIDQSKIALGDTRHRAALHHTLGCKVAEKVFGVILTLSTGREVPVRDICEQHIVEDLGWLPSPADYYKCISFAAAPWISGSVKRLTKNNIPVSKTITEQIAQTNAQRTTDKEQA